MQELLECAIFDLDGTLADTRHRLHLIKGPGKAWKQFYDACVDDPPHEYVIRLNQILAKTMTVFIASGRPDSHRKQTETWLQKYEVKYECLLMRKEKEHRADNIIKKEMLETIRGLGFEPVFAIDDRPSVVQMWRGNNVPCFAVDDTEWRADASER